VRRRSGGEDGEVPGDAAIWEYSRYLGKWTKIGGPGSMWVGVGGTVYGLRPDKSAVYKYNGVPDSWTKVGGPAENLIGGGSFFYAIQPGTGNVWRYSGKGEQWDQIGTPGTGFVAVGHTLYGMAPNKSAVYEFNDDNTESKRLRDMLYKIYAQSDFGNRVVRGFLVKRLGDQVLAEHCSDLCFQPLSTLKLLPYLHTLIEVDKGNATMTGTTVSWIQPTTGTPDAISDTTCLKASDPNTQAGSAKLKDALPTMMWESHNRTLDSLLNKYGPATITTRGQSLGLGQSEMYFGCAQAGGPQSPWADNISTLTDLARLFEGVENLTFVTKNTSRQTFHDDMINLDAAPGTAYTSPITGRTTGRSTTSSCGRSFSRRQARRNRRSSMNSCNPSRYAEKGVAVARAVTKSGNRTFWRSVLPSRRTGRSRSKSSWSVGSSVS
jgi:hypothetical protein